MSLYSSPIANVGVVAAQPQHSGVVGNANDGDSMKNEFLTLMVAQMQNQDPLNPTLYGYWLSFSYGSHVLNR